MTIKPFKRAIGFVDWNTAVIASGAKIRSGRQDTIAEKTLKHVEHIVSECLKKSAEESKFEVRLRLYAGWHSGKTRTDYLRGIDKVMRTYAGKIRSYRAGRVAFRGGNGGIQLVCCRTNKLNYMPIDDSAPIRPRARPILARISSPVACHR